MNPFGFDDDGFGQFPGQRAARPGSFRRQLRCYPVSFMDRSELEKGDKIILPPSALDLLARLNISYPMLFQLESLSSHRTTHCGVLEFLAQEGHAYIPYWMMQNLEIAEGDLFEVKNAVLEKGNFVKFQPQTVDFLSISNPKSVLERSLRSFTCLTTGDSIPINYNGKDYWIDILDVKPGNAVSIIETDINVDFAPPPGYQEPTSKPREQPLSRPGQVIFGGESSTGPRPTAGQSNSKGRKLVESSDSDSEEEKPETAEKPVQKFPGEGSVLRKQTTGRAFMPTSTSNNVEAETAAEADGKKAESLPFTAFSGVGQSLRGRVVDALAPVEAGSSEAEERGGVTDMEQEDKPKFVPFGGAGNRLRD